MKSQNQAPILPCKYVFPTTNFADAIGLAATFTDVVLGTLQDVVEIFADNNDNGLTRGVAAVIGQEGEQEGFYRILQNQNKIPSSQPFLTTSTRDFAFSALQGFVVPGSCPNEALINLKIFGPLNVLTKTILPKDQLLQFSFDLKTLNASTIASTPGASPAANNTVAASSGFRTSYVPSATAPPAAVQTHAHPKRAGPSYTVGGTTYDASYDWSQLVVVYINQQNTPKTAPLQNVQIAGSVVTFQANFPFEEDLLFGLTIAAVVQGAGPFASAKAVADATLFGPGLIEVD